MRTRTIISTIIGLAAFTLASPAAVIVDMSPGTAAPPGTLGGYSMIGFPSESRAELDAVTDVLAPPGFGGDLLFDTPLELDLIGSMWGTWSHGYAGPVYALLDAGTPVNLTLPPGALAFYLYIEPNQKEPYEFTVTSGATTATLSINGDGGAQYVGFYSDDPLSPLLGITIDQPDGNAAGFAIGEFGIGNTMSGSVPDAANCLGLTLTALGMLGLFVRKSSRS